MTAFDTSFTHTPVHSLLHNLLQLLGCGLLGARHIEIEIIWIKVSTASVVHHFDCFKYTYNCLRLEASPQGYVHLGQF